jgi:type IV pilus assembly protein PilC
VSRAFRRILFDWVGINSLGLRVKGKLSALSAQDAQIQLSRRGIESIRINKDYFALLFNKGLKQSEVVLLLQYIATMLLAGVTLPQAINIILKDNPTRALQDLLLCCKEDLIQGKPFYTSLAKFPKYFNSLSIGLIKNSEETGTLDITLKKLADYQEKKLTSHINLRRALYYPIGVLALCAIVVVVLLIFIVPQFVTLFQTFNSKLPFCTQLVINVSKLVQDYGFVFIFTIVLVWIICSLFIKKSKKCSYGIELLKLKCPFFGKMLQKVIVARLIRTLSTTLSVGVPLMDALAALVSIANHPFYRQAIIKVRAEIAAGQSLHHAIHLVGVFPGRVVQLIAIGEEAGTLDQMLDKLACFYEEEVDYSMANLNKLVEPAIMIFLGSIIGFFVMTMYLPIFKLGAVF